MIDCSKNVQAFHDEKVRLSKASQDQLRDHRRANRDRIAAGLERDSGPVVKRHVPQGSYSMHTINQEPDGAYDIDDGVAFKASDLVGSRGVALSSLDARNLVLDAVWDKSFATPPELKKNCVRVHYAGGHHVDIPVYRETLNEYGNVYLELASSSWKLSDPEAVTNWFNNAVIDKSPDKTNGRQMRRVVRLLKSFTKSRSSWNMPSGFVLSVLVDDYYKPVTGRDDEAFVETIRGIESRLAITKLVRHPVLDEYLVDDESDARMKTLSEKLSWVLGELDVLSGIGCTKLKALEAWKVAFNTDFFDERISDEKAKTQVLASALVAKTRVQPSPWCPTDAMV